MTLPDLVKIVCERVVVLHKRAINANNQVTDIWIPKFVYSNSVLICKPAKQLHKLGFS